MRERSQNQICLLKSSHHIVIRNDKGHRLIALLHSYEVQGRRLVYDNAAAVYSTLPKHVEVGCWLPRIVNVACNIGW